MHITKDIFHVGVNDHQLDLFEGQYPVPNGMAYNSYIIADEKIAVMDAVETRFSQQWLDQIRTILGDRTPDYLIVQHMEPDHSSSIFAFMQAFPGAIIVASKKAFPMMQQFYGTDFSERRVIVDEGNTLSLGAHTLTFFTAPMVHWPEVILTYDQTAEVLFSADAFGKFGALDVEDDWACEARRYYFGIVGKFGPQVLALFKKLEGAALQAICPLHGPVLTENLDYYLEKYQLWASYEAEDDGVTIACASIYGHTMEAARLLKEKLEALGCPRVALHDLARNDVFEAVEDAFRHGTLVLAASSYNGDVFPFMRDFIQHLTHRNYQNRTVALIENGTWGPTAGKTMMKLLEGSKNLSMPHPMVTIRSALNAQSTQAIEELALAIWPC
ncbi:MAG: FprA family A-type flavoprotein [Clostridiales bacterium]|nr:FprA family A-type flavoprotein [Clostridiales bacterium]